MDQEFQESKDKKFIPMTSITSRTGKEAANDVYYYTDQIVNITFIGYPDQKDWILVDAGLPYATKEIIEVAEKRFGNGNQPSCILLTHGHFDHTGGLVDLIKKWEVPVYSHPLEHPFLTGKESYPEPDATVEGGLLAKVSPMYPVEPVNIEGVIKPLSEMNQLPELKGWRWIHTPGHSPGHVSFFREEDALLLSGDAFITVRQDSLYNVMMQTPEINGPPRYLTTDWQQAWDSVKKLADLQPETVVTGHGPMMQGEPLKRGLTKLAADFESLAIPDYGKFVDRSFEGKYH
ncbi:MBL fold metallo-hydrolase [Virgibacillus sp. W0181]|uniref:MBL fold metallo-hydrolase n=1 Tax=Virgibacillus sp. W0181 TaxID=3391581 RepID=UPI003F475B7C